MSEKRRGRRRSRRRLKAAVVVAVVAVALAGGYWFAHEGSVDPRASMARAERAFETGELNSAVIDLKSVISADPSNREARFLLGRIYLQGGNPQGAIKELSRARELGLSDRELDLALTRALLLAGRFDQAATEIAIYGDTDEDDWLVLRGLLDLAQQRLDDARATFKTVLERSPEHGEARRGLMQAELAAGNAEMARRELEGLLETDTDDAELWIIKGQLDLHDGKPEAATRAFEAALDLAPESPLALMGMARALIARGELDRAANQLDRIGTDGADDPRVNFLRARIAEGKGDHNSALHALRKVLQIAPMHRQSLIMAARIHFARSELSDARDYVERLLELEPGNAAARRMLGAIQLAAGRVDGLGELGAALGEEGQAQDPGMLALLGTAHLKHGRFGDSEASLERAAELAPDSLPIRTQLALSRLGAGKPDVAVRELEAILEEDPDFAQAGIVLALVHLAQDDQESALAIADALVAKHPDDALAFNVQGYVREVAGDVDAARAAFLTALEKDPAFHPARINLARLAIQSGDTEAGRRRFEEVLEIEPFHAFALMGLAALALQNDDLDEAERLWQLAREHNPDAVAPRLLLAKHFRARNNQALAETVIEEAYRLAPYALQVQAEYAEVMLQAGRYEDALEAAQALTRRMPESVPGLELLARVYNQMGDAEGLTATLEQVAEIAPDAVGARLLLGRLAIRRQDYAQAEGIAAALREDEDTRAAGHELDGDRLAARGELEAARDAYQRAFEAAPESTTLLKLDQTERRLGRAGNRLDRWLAEHPDDLQVRFARASHLQQTGSGDAAIAEYERMLSGQRDNPVLLNNLAWLYHEAGDERALEVARRAYELAPGQPEIMDTYGWILFSAGQQEQGFELLRRAADAAPRNPDIGYHVISALHGTGAVEEARSRLVTLLGEHQSFPLREEAEALLASMDE